LKQHFDVTDKRALRFFVVHGVLDIEHSGAEREMLGVLTEGADPAPVEQTTSRTLDAWWNFLSAVDMPETVAA
jgi:pyrroloquinoline quinone (PQQ) biosynthesis protein C